MSNQYKHNGFTLIELIITMLVLSIIAAGIYITWPNSTINLSAQAEALANDIRYAQNLSMTKARRYRLVKASNTSYQITNSSGFPIMLPFGRDTVNFGRGISFGALTYLPNNLIAFDSAGVPYVDTNNPGTPLNTIATIALVSNGNVKIISIYPETGWVVIT